MHIQKVVVYLLNDKQLKFTDMENTKINVEEITKDCRVFDIQDFWSNYLNHRNHKIIIWSWGLRKPTIMKENYCFRFRVNGRLFSGHVYITLNFMDTFDIHFTSIHGVIKKKISGIYIDQMIGVLDRNIETK